MADAKSDMDANEPASAHKLKKAHERGSIFRSSELTFALVLLISVACVYSLGMQVIDGTALMVRRGLLFSSHNDLTSASAVAYVEALVSQAVSILGPVMFAVWMCALLAGALQARGVFSAQPLKPDFSRLNPANSLKRIFSITSLHELWRDSAKLAVIAGAMMGWGRHHIDGLLQFENLNSRSMLRAGVGLVGSAMALLAGIVLAFALLDWLFNRWNYLRQMRMSKRELKDEHKEREGDPRIKARLRELRVQWLKRLRQLSKVRSADVLLTNPTHVAVALEYRHGDMPAPMITARGAGEMARRMRAEALRRSVPVVENPPLARALFGLRDTEVFVPEEHFEQVARILRWVYAARGQRSMERARP